MREPHQPITLSMRSEAVRRLRHVALARVDAGERAITYADVIREIVDAWLVHLDTPPPVHDPRQLALPPIEPQPSTAIAKPTTSPRKRRTPPQNPALTPAPIRRKRKS